MLRILIVISCLLFYNNKINAVNYFQPELTFGSKFWQSPKPYIGAGITFSTVAPGLSEEFGTSFFSGLTAFNNLMFHVGMRVNGFSGVELAFMRPFKNIKDSSGNVHNFVGNILALKTLLYPLSYNFGPLLSAELFLTAGAAYIIGFSSDYKNSSGVVINDSVNNTLNILYGGGLQFGFMKYASFRFEVDVLSPLNGQSFGAPYGNVMIFYNLVVSFYPF